MLWRITHYPAGRRGSREYKVRASSLESAREKLARALGVPVWTLR